MGREIRRVIPNWEHPKRSNGSYQPMHNKIFKEVADEWVRKFQLWQKKQHPDQICLGLSCPYYWQRENPPDEEYYMEKTDQEKTWYQVYETISEGTPVTPPFETKEEIIEYLVKNGDFWDQQRRRGGWPRKHAERFVREEWSLSGICICSSEGNRILGPRDGA
jgi:hypothetical protein